MQKEKRRMRRWQHQHQQHRQAGQARSPSRRASLIAGCMGWLADAACLAGWIHWLPCPAWLPSALTDHDCEIVGRVFDADAEQDGARVDGGGGAAHALGRLAEGHGVVIVGHLGLQDRAGGRWQQGIGLR